MRSQLGRLLASLLLQAACASTIAPEAPPAPSSDRSSKKLPALLGGLSGITALGAAVPACRRGVQRLFGRPKDFVPPPKEPREASTADAASAAPTRQQPPSTPADAGSPEKFQLTPDRLATISDVRARASQHHPRAPLALPPTHCAQ